MKETQRCSVCGQPIDSSAPEGLCPRCMMARAMELTEPSRAETTDIEKVRAAFPHLEILGMVGQGGMGIVFKARQPQLERLVALKILSPERTEDAQFAERFHREAKALARLNHPNIVTIHDFGKSGPFYYLLMDFVDGVNLRQLSNARRLTPKEALAIVPSVCDALQFAHDHGIVHRDIKPENLLLDKEGRLKIADFGIAKMLGTEPSRTGMAESQPAGTPQYMAPEQLANSTTSDHRADIYSLGVVLYELLTGELPSQRLEPPSRKIQIDVRLDEVVLRALEREPERRYQTAAEVKSDLEKVTLPPEVHKQTYTPSIWTVLQMSVVATYGVALCAGALLAVLNVQLSGLLLATLMLSVALSFPAISFIVLCAISYHARATLMKVCGIFSAVASVPLIGLAVFFVNALFQERGGWHPAPAEAVTLPLIWVGSVLLPVCAWRLIKASRLTLTEGRAPLKGPLTPDLSPTPKQDPSATAPLPAEEQTRANEAEWSNPANWTGPAWLSIYFSKRDSRVWVPKQIPALGWTVNLGNGRGALMTLAILLGTLAVFLAIAITIFLSVRTAHISADQRTQLPQPTNSAPSSSERVGRVTAWLSNEDARVDGVQSWGPTNPLSIDLSNPLPVSR